MTLDTTLIDEFGRIRTSTPYTLFDSQLQYGVADLLWQSIVTAGASATHLANESAVQLSVDTTNACSCVRQTYQYIRYQPGKSQLVVLTGVLGTAKDGVTKRIGLFDANNGVFFEQTFDGIFVVKRSNVTGTPADTRVARLNWNKGILTGGSGSKDYAFDPSKAQIFVIDFQWLGVGRIRFGVNINGETIYLHEMYHANQLSNVYMTTANLPIRYEIFNTKITASSTTMKQICATVVSEGGFETERGYPFSTSNGITTRSITAKTAVLSIRPKATFNSITNRAHIQLDGVSMYVSGANILYELIYNGALTGASFASVADASVVERDVAATTITGGIVVFSDYLPAGGAIRSSEFKSIVSRLPLTLDHAGSNPIDFTVAVTPISGTAVVAAGLQWREYY